MWPLLHAAIPPSSPTTPRRPQRASAKEAGSPPAVVTATPSTLPTSCRRSCSVQSARSTRPEAPMLSLRPRPCVTLTVSVVLSQRQPLQARRRTTRASTGSPRQPARAGMGRGIAPQQLAPTPSGAASCDPGGPQCPRQPRSCVTLTVSVVLSQRQPLQARRRTTRASTGSPRQPARAGMGRGIAPRQLAPTPSGAASCDPGGPQCPRQPRSRVTLTVSVVLSQRQPLQARRRTTVLAAG